MPKINVLPKSLAELIAAGEVVERPASVVKELLENSVDAGATNITVEIKNGGISYIRITDDGCGIAREDIRNAFISHATSKISTPEDLDSILTLGFRGEALASISAVARVEIMTRTAEEETGTRYIIESGEEILLDDAGCPCGTTLIIRDLFYKTPARMKFLKKDITEANAVAGVVDRIALSHPEISIRFIRDGKQNLLTSGKGDLRSCIREIFGKEFSSALIPASYIGQGVEVSGFVSKPSYSRPNRNMQFFFINNRLIKTATGSAAVSEGYKNSIMVGKFPSCVLNIKINPSLVDVNVHPAKTEVRFSDERVIFNAIFYACKNALSAGDTPVQIQQKAKLPQDFYASPPEPVHQIKITETIKPKKDFWQNISVKVDKIEKTEEKKVEFHKFNDEITTPVTVVRSPEPQTPEIDDIDDILLNSPSVNKFVKEVQIQESVVSEQENDIIVEHKQDVEESDTSVIFEEELFHLVGEAFKTYIICEYKGKLVIIDKHAAHERIIYENLKSSSSQRTPQMLLSPVTVTLSKEEYSAVLDNIGIISQAGFEVEDFGNGCVIVRECPMEIDRDDVEEIISEIAGRFVEKKQDVSFEKLDWLFHSVACRSAIKAGNFTSRYEMERFAKQLLSMPDIRYCPHGRPVLVEMTKRELEKSFGRI